jgi:uncharacterized membrane protein
LIVSSLARRLLLNQFQSLFRFPPPWNQPPFTLARIWAVSMLLLIFVTWPLWWIATVDPHYPASAYPAIPLVPVSFLSTSTSAWCLNLLTIALLLQLIAASLVRETPSRWWIGILVCLAASFLLDQHRLQPWAYQGAIYAMVFACCDRRQSRRLITLVIASIYFYSAVGKFDFQFAHTVGQDFLRRLWSPIAWIVPMPDGAAAVRMALLFPACELVGAIGLLVARFRRAAAVLLCGMHCVLIAILGPWGADHSTSVVVWNAVLIGQTCLLFLWKPADESIEVNATPPAPPPEKLPSKPPSKPIPMVAMIAVVFVISAPIAERSGWWDHWLSWSLYSPHTSRAIIELHASSLDRLPASLRKHTDNDPDKDRWHALSIQKWSIDQRSVPVYPQGRYQLALARWIASSYELDTEIRVNYQSVSDRWSGVRQQQRMIGQRNLWK